MSTGAVPGETQEVVDKMKALCCEPGWMEHLSAAENQSGYDWTKAYQTGAIFQENLEAAGMRFDANEYFNVLTHLKPEEGYVLDYAYFAPGGDGLPRVYARPEDEPASGYSAEFDESEIGKFLEHIQTDGTEQGFFELVLLSIMGEQFYLAWHANYNDWEVVASQERLEEIVDFLKEEYHAIDENETTQAEAEESQELSQDIPLKDSRTAKHFRKNASTSPG